MSRLKFRLNALDKAMRHDQDSLTIQIITPYNWLILFAILFLFFALFLWGIFGDIQTRVKGQGILLSQNSTIFDAIAVGGNARIVAIKVKPGDRVKKNEILAYLDSPDLTKQISIQENYVKQLQNTYQELIQNSKNEITERKLQAKKIQDNLEQDIKSQTANLAITNDLIRRKETLVKKGLITREDIANTYNIYYGIKQNIDTSNNQLISNQESLESFIQSWDTKLHDMKLKLVEAERDLAKLFQELNVSKVVTSPVYGVVTSIRLAVGDPVKNGTPVVSIVDERKGMDALIYVSAQQGQKVKMDAKVLVSPTVIEKDEFGSLLGKVISTSQFPSSPESIMAVLHNEALVKKFTESGATIAIRAHIFADKSTYSGYRWTSKTGPQQRIAPGMIVDAEISVRDQSPISLILPSIKNFLESE